MNEYFDLLETRNPEQRERDLFAGLPAQVARAMAGAPAFARILKGVAASAITSRSALAALPVTRKSELLEQQKANRPFGGFAATGWGAHPNRAARVFASPGPIYEPETPRADYWRLARALFAAGFRGGDLVHNCFSYHFTPAGSMLDGGAVALGCTVFPGGIGNTEQQVQAMHDLEPAGYTGTPSFLKIILDKADEIGVPIKSLTKALVSGEAFLAPQRAAFAGRGIAGYQAYVTADVGTIAYETIAREGLVVDEAIILEIVRPGTGEPVTAGEVGEVVVTTLNPDYPLVRFGTGDLSALLPGISACGRTNVRIKGWMGRADQTAKVKGMFVHPSQVADIIRRHAEVVKARLVITNPQGVDVMTLKCEATGKPAGLPDALVATIRDVTKLRGEIELAAPGSLPNDGKIIEDLRAYT